MKEVWMPIGIPGCGKSTYLRNAAAFKNSTFIGLDLVRQELTGNMGDVSKDAQVREIVKDRLRQALVSDRPETDTIVLDATFLNAKNRKPYLDIVKTLGKDVILRVFEFSATLDICLERQKKRARQVPVEIMNQLGRLFSSFKAEEAEGLQFERKVIPAEFTLPTAEKTVSMKEIKTNKALEEKLAFLGFWREGDEWSSGRAAKLVFDENRSKSDTAMESKISQLIQRGFAVSVAEAAEPTKGKSKPRKIRFA